MRDSGQLISSLDMLPLPRRAINPLARGGIASLDEAQAWSDEALLSLPQFGPAYLAQLRNLSTPHPGTHKL